MFEKTIRLNALFDFYHSLLTEKQRNYIELYYEDDLSLGEIAEQYGVSRQAVYDNIRRTEQVLEDYENNLKLNEKFRARQQVYEDIRNELKTSDHSINIQNISSLIAKLESIE